MKIIVTADDFGYANERNIGIMEGVNNGIITSTSLLVNLSACDHAISLYKESKKNHH